MAAKDRTEIVFFDVETTVPSRKGQKFMVLEFGAILVCPWKLVELENYRTFVRPIDLSAISESSVRCNGITRNAVESAPKFEEIADKIYDLLHGRIWAGHNIISFDCVRIRDAFAQIGRPAPEAKGIIDSLHLLSQKFGRRAGNMKMATLANYFGLGNQKHRSLEDVRMNLEVLKYCATVLFLESNFPDVLPADSSSMPVRSESPCVLTRSQGQGKTSGECTPEKTDQKPVQRSAKAAINNEDKNLSTPPSQSHVSEADKEQRTPEKMDQKPVQRSSKAATNNEDENLSTSPCQSHVAEADKELAAATQLLHCLTLDDKNRGILSSVPPADPLNFAALSMQSEKCDNSDNFLEPQEISVQFLGIAQVPAYWGNQKMMLLHNKLPLQMRCRKMKIRFGFSSKFFDPRKPRLSIVVEPSPEACHIMEKCDALARDLYSDFKTKSEWRPLVTRKNGLANPVPTVRINIACTGSGETATYVTELCQRDSSGKIQNLAFRTVVISDLDKLFVPGRLVDADYSFDTYDYQQNAGIRLVADRLIVDC